MADADHYNGLLSEASVLADELQSFLNDIRPNRSILQGSTGSHRAGPGLEVYEVVDHNREEHETSQIDARISARRNKPSVRLPEDEALVHYILWRATGSHMDFSSSNQSTDEMNKSAGLKARLRALFGAKVVSPARTAQALGDTGALRTKQDAADIMLLATAKVLLSDTQTNQLSLMNGSGTVYTSDEQIGDLSAELYQTQTPSQLGGFVHETKHLSNRAKMILFSDCLLNASDQAGRAAEMNAEKDPDKQVEILVRHYEDIVADIKYLQAHDIEGHLVHIFDPLEWDFPVGRNGLPDGRIRLEWEDSEIELSRARDMRSQYLNRVNAVQRVLHETLKGAGWGYTMYVTSQPLIEGLRPLVDETVAPFDPDQPRMDGLTGQIEALPASRWPWGKAPRP